MKRRLGQQPIAADVGLLRVLLGKCGLAQPGGWLPFSVYQQVPYNLTSSGADLWAVTISRSMTLRSWWQSAVVLTTNNGSNYWTLTARKFSDLSSVATVDTSGETAGTWGSLSSLAIDAALSRSDIGLYIEATKTGSPGALYAGAPAVFVT